MEKSEKILLKKGTTKTELVNMRHPFTKGISIEIPVLVTGLSLHIANVGTGSALSEPINRNIKKQINTNGRDAYWFEHGELKDDIELDFFVSDIPYED